MIRNLSQLSGKILNITQPSIWKQNFELKYDDELIGKISSRGAFRPGLIVNILENEWELYSPKERKILLPHTIRSSSAGKEPSSCRRDKD